MPPVVLSGGGREDLSHLQPDEAAFCNYCRFVTDTQDLKDALPVSSWGQSVVYMVQVCAAHSVLALCFAAVGRFVTCFCLLWHFGWYCTALSVLYAIAVPPFQRMHKVSAASFLTEVCTCAPP